MTAVSLLDIGIIKFQLRVQAILWPYYYFVIPTPSSGAGRRMSYRTRKLAAEGWRLL